MEWTKKQRAQYLERRLNESGYPAWGRAAKIADLMSTSHSQATNWLNGAVPRDHDEIKRLASKLSLDIMEWVYGKTSDAVDERKLSEAIRTTFELGNEMPGEEFTAEHFAEVVMLVYTGKLQGAAVLHSLALLNNVREIDSGGNGSGAGGKSNGTTD